MSVQTMIVRPLTGSIGAAIEGVRLAELTDGEFEQIHSAFLDNCMLVFPGQFLSTEEHSGFAARWGEFSVSPFVTYLDGHPGVLPLTNRGKAGTITENWHYDSAFLATPPKMTILSARDVPVGGDTMWSNQYLAYETLSDGMKQLLDGLKAEFTGARLASLAGGDVEVPMTLHPVVRTHPETGRKALFIGHPGDTVANFENMTEDESRPLIDFLYEYSTRPDRVFRHTWSNGDVVMWDNRCTMHYAVHDHGDLTRELHRISITGDVPF
ncbi:MAG: TauD/TfdA family dioxygenase [Actinomycetota bacterium]|jgi:taurine dioxygenase|nr:TauD/TfdA family dioxygenase [Actinomycetota bacterium]